MDTQPVGPVSPHTVSQRFLITLFTQISKSVLSFLTGLIAARGLGPVEYGDLAFLLGSFAGLRLLLDGSAGPAFFTLGSQRLRSSSFYIYYGLWVLIVEVAAPLLLILLILPNHLVAILWQSQPRNWIWLAFIASTLQYLFWPQIIQLGEIVRRTLTAQSLTIAISLGQFVVVAFLYFFGLLTLPIFLVTTAVSFLLGTILAFFLLPHPWHPELPSQNFPSIFHEFFVYCRPLFFSYAMQALQGWAEVWLIQRLAGPTQQGFYALGMQLSLIGLVATTALQNIFWREVAEMEGSGNEEGVRISYLRTSRALLLTAAAPAAFLIPWAPEIVRFALGGQYLAAAPAVAILFLYPITQCLTTLAYVIFSIMRRTGRLAQFAGLTAFLNIVGAYFVLGSPHAAVPGLGLGAMGVAVKTVSLAFLNLYWMEAWISRNRHWPQDWAYRFALVAFLAMTALVSRIVGGLVAMALPTLAALALSALLFATLLGVAFFYWPSLAGLDRKTRDNYLLRARELFARD